MSRYFLTAIAAALTLIACGKTYEAEELPRVFTLERGTQLAVNSIDPIAPQRMSEGEAFAGVLAEPLELEGVLIAPRGAPVAGSVVLQQIEQEGESATIHGIELRSLTLHGGEDFEISTAPLFQEAVVNDAQADAQIGDGRKLIFVLDEDAEVSMVIDRSAVS